MNIKEIVANNKVKFSRYRQGYLYYTVKVDLMVFEFPVPIEDTGEATFKAEDKAITFMRYIRKALEEKTFVNVTTGL